MTYCFLPWSLLTTVTNDHVQQARLSVIHWTLPCDVSFESEFIRLQRTTLQAAITSFWMVKLTLSFSRVWDMFHFNQRSFRGHHSGSKSWKCCHMVDKSHTWACSTSKHWPLNFLKELVTTVWPTSPMLATVTKNMAQSGTNRPIC